MKHLFSLKNDLLPLLKLAIPFALTGLLQSSVFFFETVFLAHVSPDVLAAGSLATWLFGTIAVIFFGILSAINILVAFNHGAKNTLAISYIVRDGLLLSVLLVVPIFLLLWNMSPVFKLFGQHANIIALTSIYLRAFAWGLLPSFVMAALLQFIMGLGHTRIIVIFSIFSVGINLFFSYALIFGKFAMPTLGIAGAGWGMTISNWISVFVLIAYVGYKKNYRVYLQHVFHISKPRYIGELLQVGLPMGAMFCIEVGFFFAMTLIMGSISSQILAANQIAFQYLGTLIGIVFSIAQAVTVRMGHLLGAHEVNLAARTTYAGLCLSAIYMLIIAVCYWCFSSTLISIDFDINAAQNKEIISFAKQFLYAAAVFQLFEAMRITLFGALRALKDTQFTLLTSIISFWLIALPLGYLLASYFAMGGLGLWCAMVLSALVGASLLFWRFEVKMKRHCERSAAI